MNARIRTRSLAPGTPTTVLLMTMATMLMLQMVASMTT